MHRIRIFAAALLLAACAASPPEAILPATAPSVLLVTLDTARADRFGFDGYSEPTSPHLDRLAGESLVFTRAIAQASVTPVSHASIFTGLNPYRHGLRVFGTRENRLAAEQLTLAEMLRGLGYATAAFVSAFPASRLFGLGQGFDVFDEDFVDENGDDPGQRRAGATTERALSWLAQAPARFFLWVHYFDPHDAKVLPPADFLGGLDPDDGPAEEVYPALYDREIAYMDAEIGRLLAALRADGRFEELLIVVVADHGQGLGDHGWWTHAILYQEQLRVPLVVKLPRSRSESARPRRIGFQVRTVDVVPTVLDALGLPTDAAPFDGRSLLPLAADGAEDPGLVAYADALSMATFEYGPGLADEVKDEMLLMVSDGRWKYIHHVLRPAESELYDLANDPRELANVLARHPGEVRRLQADLLARDPFLRQAEPGSASVEMSEQDRRRLKALGYVQ